MSSILHLAFVLDHIYNHPRSSKIQVVQWTLSSLVLLQLNIRSLHSKTATKYVLTVDEQAKLMFITEGWVDKLGGTDLTKCFHLGFLCSSTSIELDVETNQ